MGGEVGRHRDHVGPALALLDLGPVDCASMVGHVPPSGYDGEPEQHAHNGRQRREPTVAPRLPTLVAENPEQQPHEEEPFSVGHEAVAESHPMSGRRQPMSGSR
jgi:hypothetical protein